MMKAVIALTCVVALTIASNPGASPVFFFADDATFKGSNVQVLDRISFEQLGGILATVASGGSDPYVHGTSAPRLILIGDMPKLTGSLVVSHASDLGNLKSQMESSPSSLTLQYVHSHDPSKNAAVDIGVGLTNSVVYASADGSQGMTFSALQEEIASGAFPPEGKTTVLVAHLPDDFHAADQAMGRIVSALSRAGVGGVVGVFSGAAGTTDEESLVASPLLGRQLLEDVDYGKADNVTVVYWTPATYMGLVAVVVFILIAYCGILCMCDMQVPTVYELPEKKMT